MATNVRVAEGAVVGFDTKRLSARKMSPADADYLQTIHQDPAVMATVGGVRDEDESATWLQTNLDHWRTFGFGQWMLDRQGVCIGRGGLRKIDASVGEDLVEVGYVFDREHWGLGFATEATRSFLQIAVEHYRIEELGAITLKGNDASTRVLEKCGFVFERWVDHPVGPHKFLRFRVAE